MTPGTGAAIHHVKGLSVLLAITVAIVASVVGLRHLIAPERPTFADEVAAAGTDSFLPSTYGGELAVSGDRQGNMSLTGPTESGEGFGLQGDEGRMFFEGAEGDIAVGQFSYDGLEFFPAEGECTVTPGEADERAGVGGAEVSCADIRDIRDNATITVRGHVGLPIDMVVDRELPPVGGTLTAGEETWRISYAFLNLMPGPAVAGEETYPLVMHDERSVFLYFTYEDERLALDVVEREGVASDVPAGSCQVDTEELVRLDPETSRLQVSVDCPVLDLEGLGDVPVAGSVVIERLTAPPGEH